MFEKFSKFAWNDGCELCIIQVSSLKFGNFNIFHKNGQTCSMSSQNICVWRNYHQHRSQSRCEWERCWRLLISDWMIGRAIAEDIIANYKRVIRHKKLNMMAVAIVDRWLIIIHSKWHFRSVFVKRLLTLRTINTG